MFNISFIILCTTLKANSFKHYGFEIMVVIVIVILIINIIIIIFCLSKRHKLIFTLDQYMTCIPFVFCFFWRRGESSRLPPIWSSIDSGLDAICRSS